MKALLLALLSVAITSCAVGPSMPSAAKTAHMEVATAGAGLKTKSSSKPYNLHVGIILKESVEVPVFAKATFENPENPSKPFIVTQRIESRGKLVVIRTPQFAKRPESRLMGVNVELYRDASQRQKLDQLSQQFLATLPSDQEMRKAGLGHLVD
jgi:hypothetical protein